jgi:hypothetical protein
MAVSKFYDLFPKVKYDINKVRGKASNYEEVINIYYRLGVIRNVINNIYSYTVYDIEDGDTPEILAEKFYGDAGGAWLILLANNIMDAQFEWPLDDSSFNQYVIEKYGSLEYALTTPHHYEKVIKRKNIRTDVENITRFWVNGERLTENMPDDIPFSYYEPWTSTTYRTADSTVYTADSETVDLLADLDNGEAFGATLDRGNLAITGEYAVPNVYDINGEQIQVTINGEIVYCYEHEKRLNDDRRSIKIIKSEYYTQIQDEFKAMVSNRPTYIRRLV